MDHLAIPTLSADGRRIEFLGRAVGLDWPAASAAHAEESALRIEPGHGGVALHLPGASAALTVGEAAWLEGRWLDLRAHSEPIPTPLAIDLGGVHLALGAERGRANVMARWEAAAQSLHLDFEGVGEPRLWLAAAPGPREALEGVALAMMGEIHPVTPLRGALFGWMSWDELRAEITERDIEEHAALLAQRLPSERAIVLIDDGWQRATGHWEPNPKFPSGMEALTRRIHDLGLRAGLWVAPFMAALDSPVAREHPGWLLRGEADEPFTPQDFPHWGGRSGVLDVTQPDVVGWLCGLADRIGAWGFDYVKFDFLANALMGRSRDEAAPRALAYREAIRAMRQVLGPQVMCMGCGTRLVEGRGLFDAARIGDDVVTDWSLLHSRLSNMAIRQPLHRRWWWNDPDNVLLREPFTQSEARAWASMAAMAEGCIFLGDDLRKLPPERFAIAQRIWPPAPARCHPLGLEDPVSDDSRPAARGWAAKVERQWQTSWVVALLNWEDEPRTLRATWEEIGIGPQARCHAWDFWAKAPLGLRAGEIEREVPPHSVSVVALTPVEPVPQVIGCDRHVVVGAVGLFGVEWEPRSASLRGRVEDALPGLATEFAVALPPGRRVGEVRGAHLLGESQAEGGRIAVLAMERAGRWALHCPEG